MDAHDPCVGLLAAQNARVQHAGQLDVPGVLGPSRDALGRVDARRWLADDVVFGHDGTSPRMSSPACITAACMWL
jgi:hypothetical protein